MYTRVKSTNYIKLHYDHGLTQCYGKQWNFYASFWTDKSLSKSSVRVGAASYHPNCTSDNRIRVNATSGAHSFYWYNRTLATHTNLKFGLVSVVDLTNQVIQKNNILLGYGFKNKNEAFLRFENEGYRSANPKIANIASLWDTVTANFVAKIDSTTKVGVEVINFLFYRPH